MAEKSLAPRELFGGLGDLDEKALRELAKSEGAARGSATGEEIRDALGGITPRLERIEVKHQAGVFRSEAGETFDAMLGVIAAHTYRNTYWDTSFEDREEGSRPPCYSPDGRNVAVDAEGPQAASCTVCSRNRSAPQGSRARQDAFDRDRKECCNNYLVLAVSRPGAEIPYEVRLSNRSFKAWAAYVQRIGTHGRFLPHEVVTRLKLRVEHGVADYSVCDFEFVGPLPPELAKAFSTTRDGYRQLLRRASAAEEADVDDSRSAAEAVAQARREQDAAEVPF